MAGSVMEDVCGRKRSAERGGVGAFLCAPVTIKVARIITTEELCEPKEPGRAKRGCIIFAVAEVEIGRIEPQGRDLKRLLNATPSSSGVAMATVKRFRGLESAGVLSAVPTSGVTAASCLALTNCVLTGHTT
jgi:hypothetical protein